MYIIDTHCHLDVEDFDKDRQEIIDQCYRLGIRNIVVPAVDRNGWKKLLEICAANAGLLPALGLHPVYIDTHKDRHLEELDEWLDEPGVIAVGEIGLDYFVRALDPGKQQVYFERQLLLAKNHDLPVLLHVRKAHDKVLSALKKHKVKGGIAHAFNGSLQQANQYIDLGFKLGFGGTMTYERSQKIRALAKELPLDAIVLETDAPDMVVSSHRGERNSPVYLVECLNSLVEIRGMSLDEVARITTMNALEVLGLQ